jgi:hypothetical protein
MYAYTGRADVSEGLTCIECHELLPDALLVALRGIEQLSTGAAGRVHSLGLADSKGAVGALDHICT